MLRALTGMIIGLSLAAAPVLAQTTTTTVLTGEAFGFQVMNSTTPDPFTFDAQSGVEPNGIDVISNIITISGITEPVTASVSDLGGGGAPKISVNGGLYTTGPVQVEEGDSLRVSLLPETGVFSRTYQAEVTVGDGSAIFSVTTRAADTTPDAFIFLSANNQEPGTVVSSAPATITGLEAPAAVSVTGTGGAPQISLDGGLNWGVSGSVANNGTVLVRLTSGTFGETRTATVTIGGVTTDFAVTTRSSNENPVFADFTDQTGVEPSVTITSDAVTVTGIETTVTASVSGDGLPELQVNGGAWVPAGSNASVSNNDTIRLRLTSGAVGETRTATLDVNGVTQTFSATTRSADTEPEAFTVAAVTNAAAGAVVQSSATITGIEAPAVVTISGEGTPAFSTDEGATWVDASGSGLVENGGTILVRLTAGSFDVTRTATLSVGGVTSDFTVTTEPQDTAPDAFAFTSALAIEGSVSTSDVVTLAGFTGSVPISVSGDGSPEYRIGAGNWTSTAGTVTSGQQVQVRLTAAWTERTVRTATLSVGAGSGTFSVETQDRTPSALTFASVTGAALNTVVTSDPVTISGITGSVPVAVEAAFSAAYRINGGTWVSTPGTVQDGDTVSVRFVSANAYATERSVGLTVGTVSGAFSVTTDAQDTTPDAFAFEPRLVAPGTADVASESVVLTGFQGSVPVSLSGEASGEFRIGTDSGGSVTWGAWTNVDGNVSAGQMIQLRLDTPASEGATRNLTVEVGSGSALYTVTTQDLTPDAFAFAPVTGASLGAATFSEPVQISSVTGSVTVSIPEGNGAVFRIGTGPDVDNITWGVEGLLDHTAIGATVSDGGWVQVRLTASGAYETQVSTTLTVGTGSAGFFVTTGPQPVSITITSGTVPDAEEGQAYGGFDFTTVASVSGGSASSPPTVNDLTWSVISGALPAGMSVSAAGDLTGTPTEIGAFSFTVQAALGAQNASASYSIIVNDPDGSFVIEGG
jgi:hypothetical protein